MSGDLPIPSHAHLTGNLPYFSGVVSWRHLLTVPVHCRKNWLIRLLNRVSKTMLEVQAIAPLRSCMTLKYHIPWELCVLRIQRSCRFFWYVSTVVAGISNKMPKTNGFESYDRNSTQATSIAGECRLDDAAQLM